MKTMREAIVKCIIYGCIIIALLAMVSSGCVEREEDVYSITMDDTTQSHIPDTTLTIEDDQIPPAYQKENWEQRKPCPLLSPGERWSYQDEGRNNDISIALIHATSRGSFFYNTAYGTMTVNPPSDNRILLVSIKVWHMGSRSVSDQQITTPGLPSFTLYDSSKTLSPTYISIDDGGFIDAAYLNRYDDHQRPLYPWARNIVHHTSIGELYSETTLHRQEEKEGWLLFLVPEGFAIDDAYLGLQPDKDEKTIYWSLC